MYGQMTAGSWIYIGTQGIVQGTYETFSGVGAPALWRLAQRPRLTDGRYRRDGRCAAARDRDERRGGPDRRRRSPLAPRPPARFAVSRRCGNVARGCATRGCAREGFEAKQSRSGATKLERRGRDFPTLYELGFRPDVVTDQTSAHDLLNGYVPTGLSLYDSGGAARAAIPWNTSDARLRVARRTSKRWVH